MFGLSDAHPVQANTKGWIESIVSYLSRESKSFTLSGDRLLRFQQSFCSFLRTPSRLLSFMFGSLFLCRPRTHEKTKSAHNSVCTEMENTFYLSICDWLFLVYVFGCEWLYHSSTSYGYGKMHERIETKT